MRRSAHTAWRQIGEETIVVDLQGRRILGLGEVSGWIWSLFDGHRSVDEIVAAVAALAGAPAGSADATRALIERLTELGLLEAGTPTGPALVANPPPQYRTPEVGWIEPLEQAAASCGFISGQTPLCTQVPSI